MKAYKVESLNKGVAVGTFDATGGKNIGAYSMGAKVPAKAMITRAWYKVTTTFTSAGADAGTIAIHAESADDIVAAIAISNGGNPWDAGKHEGIEIDTAATAVETTADRTLTVTVGAQNLTAGKLVLWVEYVHVPDSMAG